MSIRWLIEAFEDADMALDGADNRMAREIGSTDDVELAAASLISAAEEIMAYAERRSAEADEHVAYWRCPLARRERMAAE